MMRLVFLIGRRMGRHLLVGRTAVSAINAGDRLQMTGHNDKNLRDAGIIEAGGAGVSPVID